MFRLLGLVLSEASAIAFAAYLGVFLFRAPDYTPPLESAIESAFIFCGIGVAYLWIQSASLAGSGHNTTLGMAAYILTSFAPVFVVVVALIDHWRGGLPLSLFKQYAAYFALGIVLLDVTCNTTIMVRLSRRYVGLS